jgi:hypothetical protein
MDGSSMTMMVVGMVIIWGGLAASIAHAVKKVKHQDKKTGSISFPFFYFFFSSKRSFRSHVLN